MRGSDAWPGPPMVLPVTQAAPTRAFDTTATLGRVKGKRPGEQP